MFYLLHFMADSKKTIDCMLYCKKEDDCFEKAQIDGKDTLTGKQAASHLKT